MPPSSSSSSPPSQEPLKFIQLPPKTKHSATVFFIHGLGDTGHGWKPVADMFRQDPALNHVKWILPHSFDIYSFGFNTDEDEVGMIQSARSINQLIMNEIESGMDPSRIVLGGFSQGATMSLLTGLTGNVQLGGIVMASSNASSIPVFWGQGTQDPLVKSTFGRESADFLVTELGMPVGKPNECRGLSFITYDGLGHATNQTELADMCNWMKKAIPGDKARK
ncbi:hypothetical protein ONZ45_g4898 [Pleurotus djamor]|nr:hypothetical protein ONZ45_g4898 [Pleurotus djamor]